MRSFHALGLMSGSSLDGVDLALCRFDVEGQSADFQLVDWQFLAAGTVSFPENWKERLIHLPKASALELAHAHADMGHFFGETAAGFLQRTTSNQQQPTIISSHGHTIFHDPSRHFTTQIGDGAAIAARTRCTVVCDFRSTDVALGGQGAPLAALADKLLFNGYDFYLNIGGIANLTCNANGKYVAFDIGGANQILDALAREVGLPFDEDGKLAAAGSLNEALFEEMNGLEYFGQAYPKSLSNQWVQENEVAVFLKNSASVNDRLRTACEQLAFQVAKSIRQVIDQEHFTKEKYRLFATGGGALNGFLMSCIRQYCGAIAPVEVVVPEADIVKFKEAIFMGMLGVMRLLEVPNTMRSVTGAERDAVNGAVYFGG